MKKSIRKNIVVAIPTALVTGIMEVISDDIPFSSPSFWTELIQHFLIFSITYLIVGVLFDYFFGNEKK
ncbi:MAG: hypothetical protein IKM20_06000 [Erysipelotrichales bacterium]|nr:hypothetical protein [Erysipelotrichales bacterium]